MACAAALSSCGDHTGWYDVENENKPYLRWWWLGSAVDREGLTYNLEEFASKGIGGVEITPLYGVIGNEENDIQYLSPKWMEMLSHCILEGERLGLQIDMSNCTGWPFGGPWISAEDAAMTFAFNEDTTAVFGVQTKQKVKRAAPGGEGWVMNHYDIDVLDRYLAPFEKAFTESGCPWPDTFFNDSFEVYRAGWDDKLPEAFFADHGYRLEDHLKEFAANDGSEASKKVIADYRATLGRLYLENFVRPWTAWAHTHGVRTRNQAHGAPANLIDVYAAADIPECEGFGQSPFTIKGLHHTGGDIRPNDADPAAFKFASSAAHISGKQLVSCESLTWLTDHFNTTLSLCKPEIDLILASGINHVYLHGAPYSPKGIDFPGWKFYATINLSPTNPSIWDHCEGFLDYIARCQAFLSAGSPDADFLLYFPIEDVWMHDFKTQFMMLDIQKMHITMPEFKEDVMTVLNKGYDVDYISDDFLQGVEVMSDGRLKTASGTVYKGLVIPRCELMPESTEAKIEELAKAGAKILGMDSLEESGVVPETVMKRDGMHMVRRLNEVGGKNYFLANLGPEDLDGWVDLACEAEAVEIFDAMSGERGFAAVSDSLDGRTSVRLQIPSGGSLLLKSFPRKIRKASCGDWKYYTESGDALNLGLGDWTLEFLESAPEMPENVYELDSLTEWTGLPGADVIQATARYSTTFIVEDPSSADEWRLDLGDVRESAIVHINGKELPELYAVPFSVNIGSYLKAGENRLEIDVTNLPANRIAQMDRDKIIWRIFKDVNIASPVSRPYTEYDGCGPYSIWPVAPSGLNSTVTITPLKID
ncbi:MAG: glycosyl hydrolase family 2 [Bacteroidales bacterium]|nr:glycosyl hydrolase family 2 [Bacteroidales bacterium]